MRPLVSTSLAAAILFWGTLAFWMLAGPRRRKGAREVRRDRGTVVLIVVLNGLGIGLGLAAASAERFAIRASPWSLFVAGLAVMWTGIALALWAVHSLGRFYRPVVAIQEGHEVVTTGPYRLVRHPVYAGALLVVLGAGLALGSWLSVLLCVLVPLPAYLLRIRVEERLLEESLGDSYRRYAAGRARLVPGLW